MPCHPLLATRSRHSQSGGRMKKTYSPPKLVEYGRIADCTFATPGGFKGCKTDCHIDNFGEQSALTTTGS